MENTNACHENLLEGVTTEGLIRSTSTVSSKVALREHKDCLTSVPKNTLTFLRQIVVVYGIITVSVYHLSVQSPNQELWLILLSSAFGYIPPSPGLKYLKQSQRSVIPHATLSVLDAADETDAVDVEKKNSSNKFSGQ